VANVIALAGKGGTGKTTMAGLIIRALRRRGGGAILAVDADPNACLETALGMPAPRTISDVLDASHGLRDVPTAMAKPLWVEYQVEDCLSEGRGVDLIVMGRPEGASCYCAANQMLRTCLDRMLASYPRVVIDNEAGMEHLSRRTTRDVDFLLVVSDPTITGLRAARRIATLVAELGLPVKRIGLVVSGAEGGQLPGPIREAIAADGLSLVGVVPFDPLITALELASRPIFDLPDDSPAAAAVEAMLDREFAVPAGASAALDASTTPSPGPVAGAPA
jgi:CO dehydrogenase maturation factor